MVTSLSVGSVGGRSGGNWPSRLPSITRLMTSIAVSASLAGCGEPMGARMRVMRWNSAAMSVVDAAEAAMAFDDGAAKEANVKPGGDGDGDDSNGVVGGRGTPAPNIDDVECNVFPVPCSHGKLVSLAVCCWFLDVRDCCMSSQPCMSALTVEVGVEVGAVLGGATVPRNVLNGSDDDDGDGGNGGAMDWVDDGMVGVVVGM